MIQNEGGDKVKVTRNSGRSGGSDERRAGKQPARTLTPLEICRRFDPDFVDPVAVRPATITANVVEERESGDDGDGE